MENYDELVRQSGKFNKDKDQKYKEVSKERLLKIASKKIQTTMIGALSAIEASFGFLWGHDDDESLSPEQEHMKELYDDLRSEILDKGNNQIRNLEAEFAHYDIHWLRYRMVLPMKTIQEEGEDNGGQD